MEKGNGKGKRLGERLVGVGSWPNYAGWCFSATVRGELASKSNSRRAVFCGGKPRFIKSDKALGWVDSFAKQVPRPLKAYDGDIALTAVVYYASRRPDLDISLLMDSLQKQGIILNDRQVKELHIFHAIDKTDARVEFELTAIDCSKKLL